MDIDAERHFKIRDTKSHQSDRVCILNEHRQARQDTTPTRSNWTAQKLLANIGFLNDRKLFRLGGLSHHLLLETNILMQRPGVGNSQLRGLLDVSSGSHVELRLTHQHPHRRCQSCMLWKAVYG